MDLVSPIRGRISTFKRCSSTFESRKSNASFSVACCMLGPAQYEEGPSVRTDWRAFRARLVAREQAPPVEERRGDDKWAHGIYEPERGCLLIATKKLDGVHIFERTVIMLLSTGPEGPTTGLILNRPSLMSIKEMQPLVPGPVFFGGPVEEDVFLVSPRGEGVLEKVVEGVYYGTKGSVGCAAEMVERKVVEAEELRFFHGYCAWEREQLSDEIRAGYWAVAACSPSVIQQATVGLWEEISGLMGPTKVW